MSSKKPNEKAKPKAQATDKAKSADNRSPINLTWKQIEDDAKTLARKIQPANFSGIIAVARGGLIPASLVGRFLNIRRFEVMSVESYDDRIRGGHTIIHKPEVQNPKEWVMIDELADSGATSNLLKAFYPECKLAVLYVKRPIGGNGVDFHVRDYPQDSWLVFPWEKLVS